MPTWNAVCQARPQEFIHLLSDALASAASPRLVTAPSAGLPVPGARSETIVCNPRLARSAASTAFARIPWKK
jgi:hypothetical protein